MFSSSSSSSKSFLAGLLLIGPSPRLCEWIPGIAPTIQEQGLALGLVEPHEFHMGPLLEVVQAPLDVILSFRYVICTPQVGVIRKLAGSALDPTVNVLDEQIYQY